jgi:hypothetical protein
MQPQEPNQQPGQAAPQSDGNSDDAAVYEGKRVMNPLESMQPGEQVVCEIKRHPIGILGIYITLICAVALVAIVGFGFGPQIFANYETQQVYGYVTVATLVLGVLCLLFGYIAHIVYWGNRWIVTDDSVTQVSQVSLFNKQSSQLSMGNLEDITAEKNGIIQHMFNFGNLRCETAGAQKSKFVFPYCPNPEYFAKCILDAREKFEYQHYRNSPNPANPGGVNQNAATGQQNQ